ncbi:MAG: hypothetical protein ACKOCX_03765, partial [Planctomycetota bacterium]
LEAFERVCIESDLHLAEAADCHGLLAELARDPASIPPLDRGLRKRLLARLAEDVAKLPREEAHAPLAPAAKGAADKGRRATAASRGGREAAATDRRPRKKASLAAWLSAAVALLLLLSLAGLLGWSLFAGGKSAREVAVAKPAPDAPPAAAREPAPDAPPAAAPPVEPAPPALAAAVPPAAPAVAEPASAAISPPAAPPAVADALPAAAADGPPGGAEPGDAPPPPAAPAAAIAAVPLPQMEAADDEPSPDDPLPDEPAAPPAAAAPAPPPGIVAEGGAILHLVRAGDAAHWQALAAGSPLAAVEEFVVPAQAYPRLIRGDVSIRLQPGTQATLTTDGDGTPRLEIVFGKAIAWTEAAEATLGITAGGLAGVVTLGTRQPVGVDVELTRSPGDDPAVVPPGRRASLHTVGGIGWRQTEIDGGPLGQPLAGIALEQPLPPRGGLSWNSADPGTAALDPAAAVPDWMNQAAPASRLDRAAAASLAAAVAADRPAEESLRMLATDRRIENRMAAASTLALLGDYGPLVDLLCDERPGEKLSDSQWEAFQAATVPVALARGANAAARLRQAFAARGPAGRGDDIFTLARGLSADERAANAQALVEMLADPALVVRRYAFLELAALAPDDPAGRLDYRPDRSAALNERGVEWWRRKVAAGAGASP